MKATNVKPLIKNLFPNHKHMELNLKILAIILVESKHIRLTKKILFVFLLKEKPYFIIWLKVFPLST